MRKENTGNISDPSKWVSKYGDYLFNYAISRLQNETIAEDIVQDTFLSALKGVKNFRGDSSEKTWLVSILKRKIIDYYRSSIRKKEDVEPFDSNKLQGNNNFFITEGNSAGAWQADAIPNQWVFSTSSSIENKEFQQIFQNCLSKLPEKVAATFALKVVEEISTEEVCKELDITASNLWVMLHRARLQLRACLEKNWFGKTN